MQLRPVLAAAALAAAVACASSASAAESLTVPGSSDIFAAGQAGTLTTDQGTLPPFIYVSAGQTLTITATGIINCCDTSSTPGTSTPDGFAQNPFTGGGSNISSSFGNGLTYTGPNSFALAAVFGNTTSGDPFGTVYDVGSSYKLTVPTGAGVIYFGLPDGSGFNGPSGFYGDNNGEFDVSVSGAPEPSSWALMMGGVGFFGMALRSRRRRQLSLA